MIQLMVEPSWNSPIKTSWSKNILLSNVEVQNDIPESEMFRKFLTLTQLYVLFQKYFYEYLFHG